MEVIVHSRGNRGKVMRGTHVVKASGQDGSTMHLKWKVVEIGSSGNDIHSNFQVPN